MISFRYDYYSSYHNPYVDQEMHIRHCNTCCCSGKTCYRMLHANSYCYGISNNSICISERSVRIDKLSYTIYLCYLLYAPLYIVGHIISFNTFVSQLDTPQKSYTQKQVAWYVESGNSYHLWKSSLMDMG
uniref:Uncharacterized protein n=1 Tax=Lactuca sativa TaxID=4236 RepID=A0A9R1XN56_LACSA|nr:hypothetical protein LSAT_V11C300129280 [Lactuca sativa]